MYIAVQYILCDKKWLTVPLAWQFCGSSSLLSPQSLYPLHNANSLMQRLVPPGHGMKPGLHVGALGVAAMHSYFGIIIIIIIIGNNNSSNINSLKRKNSGSNRNKIFKN